MRVEHLAIGAEEAATGRKARVFFNQWQLAALAFPLGMGQPVLA